MATTIVLASHKITSPAAAEAPACPLVYKRSAAQTCMLQRGRPSTVRSSMVCAGQLQAKQYRRNSLISSGSTPSTAYTNTNDNNNNNREFPHGLHYTTTKNKYNHHELPHGLDASKLPPHVGIIMDGNSRWAQAKGITRFEGHNAGMKTLMDMIWLSSDWGLSAFTVFLFSTENWNRSQEEVSSLMEIFESNFIEHLEKFSKYNIKVKIIGDTKRLPMSLQNIILEMENRTSTNTGLKVAFALNYGGHLDLVQAFQHVAKKIQKKKINIEDISEQVIENELWTSWMGDYQNIDLLIRTSGERRISNFLLWQAAYSEIRFIDTFWPSFNDLIYARCLVSYQSCDRRFGTKQPLKLAEE